MSKRAKQMYVAWGDSITKLGASLEDAVSQRRSAFTWQRHRQGPMHASGSYVATVQAYGVLG